MATQTEPTSVHDFAMTTITGHTKSLADYRGKALLIVNTASRCGFTPQYTGLQTLYDRYRARGLEILAFPANNFMGQEPGTNEEIKTFCETTYQVTFPLFAKISVKGKDTHPLYQFLTTRPGLEGDISWNFNKFLVDAEGRMVARFGSRTEPLASELTQQLESLLPNS